MPQKYKRKLPPYRMTVEGKDNYFCRLCNAYRPKDEFQPSYIHYKRRVCAVHSRTIRFFQINKTVETKLLTCSTTREKRRPDWRPHTITLDAIEAMLAEYKREHGESVDLNKVSMVRKDMRFPLSASNVMIVSQREALKRRLPRTPV